MRHQAGADPRDVVAAKRDGGEVPPDELRAFVLGYSRGEIPDYLAAAFLMAAYINGLSSGETTELTLVDVKAGNGAFMKTPWAAAELAEGCVALASDWGRPARAAVTDMSQPLGSAIGNAIEVAEAVRLLRGEERGRLRELAVAFAAEALTSLMGQKAAAAATAAERALDD